MNRTPLALLAVATLALAACGTPAASVDQSSATTSAATQTRAAESTPAPSTQAPAPRPKPKPTKTKAATKSAPVNPEDPIWAYFVNIANNAAPNSDTGWMDLVVGAEDDGSALRIYTTVDADEWMYSETARADYDVEGVCIGSMVYAGIMNDKGLRKYKEVWVMGSNLEPIEGCSWNDLTADMNGDYAKGDN